MDSLVVTTAFAEVNFVEKAPGRARRASVLRAFFTKSVNYYWIFLEFGVGVKILNLGQLLSILSFVFFRQAVSRSSRRARHDGASESF